MGENRVKQGLKGLRKKYYREERLSMESVSKLKKKFTEKDDNKANRACITRKVENKLSI